MNKLNDAQSFFLDALRVFSVQLLVVGHALPYFNIGRENNLQNSAVILFFVLSGIVISYSVFRKMESGNYRFRDYFIDRFSRIYTALIPCLLFILFIDSVQLYFFGSEQYRYSSAFDINTFFGNLLMLQDFPVFNLGITSFGSGRPLWTLAIEWWLYMAFGIFIIHFQKQFTKKYLIIFCLFLIVPVYNSYTGRGGSLTLFWLLGVVVTLLLFRKGALFNKSTLFLLIILTFSLVILRLNLTKEAYDLVYVTLVSLFILFVLQLLSHYTFSLSNFKKYIRFIASYSFTLFLVHYSIFDFIAVLNKENSYLYVFFLSIVISNIVSVVIAYYTEMRYKKFAQYLRMNINYFGRNYAKQ